MKNLKHSSLNRWLCLMAFSLVASISTYAQTGHAFTFTETEGGAYICRMDDFEDVGYGVCVKLWHYYNNDSWYTYLDWEYKGTERNLQADVSKMLYAQSDEGKVSTDIVLVLDDETIITLKDHSVRVENPAKTIEMNMCLDAGTSEFKRLLAHNIIGFKVLGVVVPLNNFKSAITLKRMHNRIVEAQNGGSSGGNYNSGNSGSNLRYNSSGGFSYGGTTRYITPATSSQLSRLRDNLKNNDACKVGAITTYGAGVVIRGGNGYFTTSSTPESLTNKLKSINNDRKTIVDVNITEQGHYVVIFGKNGYSVSNSAPSRFIDALKKYNNDNEEIWSACFTEGGRWGIVTDQHMWGDSETNAFLKEAEEHCGEVLTIFLTDYSRVAFCKNGVYYQNLPSNIVEKLGELKFKPKFIKFTDDGLFLITGDDGTSNNWYL